MHNKYNKVTRKRLLMKRSDESRANNQCSSQVHTRHKRGLASPDSETGTVVQFGPADKEYTLEITTCETVSGEDRGKAHQGARIIHEGGKEDRRTLAFVCVVVLNTS